jgi:uncharacterized coiled-coil protein SlyX
MAVPAQVQARADKADELLKQVQASTEKPAGEVPATPTGDRDKDKPAQAETVDSLKALLAEAQQKLATLQGKYNSEIQALKDDVNLLNNLKNQVRTLTDRTSDLSGKLTEANRLIGELQKQITEKPAVPADDGKSALSSLSEDDLEYLRGEGFDDKTLGILIKALSKKDQAKPAQNQDEIAEIRKKVKEFWKEINDKVPDWEPINGSDPFNDWLDLRLPYSNETRRDRLQAAQKESDYATAIQIFNDFKRENPAAATHKPEHRIDPAKQIEPASSVVHQPPADGKPAPAGKIYTRQEVREFYAELSKAAAKGNVTDEMKKTDLDIIAANAQGRIQG